MTIGLGPLVLIALFQLKHALADFYLQSNWMAANKGRYGHPAGFAHAGIHVGLSALVLLLFGVPVILTLALIAAEFVVHYHTDWAKDQLIRRDSLEPTAARFWNLTGLDQLVHHLTNLGMVAVVLALGFAQ